MSTPIINHPTKVFTLLAPESGVFSREDIDAQKKHLLALGSERGRISLYEKDVFMCEVFPDWMLEAGPRLVGHYQIVQMLARNPLIAVQMLLFFYERTRATLEAKVLASGEATVSLLLAIDEGKITPEQKRANYEKTLLAEPWWALQYLSNSSPSSSITASRRDFAELLRERVAREAPTSGQAALVHLLLNPSLSPDEFRVPLLSTGMTAYLGSRLLCARNFAPLAEEVQGLDARWATHIALWGAFIGGTVTPAIERAIACHAGWMGEYIARSTDRHNDYSWVLSLYTLTENTMHNGDSTGSPDWNDPLWAMLDRILAAIDGRNPRMTIAESLERAQKVRVAPQN